MEFEPTSEPGLPPELAPDPPPPLRSASSGNWLFWIPGLALFGLFVVLPAAEMWFPDTRLAIQPHSRDFSLVQQIQQVVLEALIPLWLFFVGASIGSFLNVLVYRIPLGRSVALDRSHCPLCGSAIRFSDNLPVLGWLRLGGRCRSCGCRIALRYPLVEALCGLGFLLLCFFELLSGGANLPVRAPGEMQSAVWILLFPRWDLIGLYAFHGLLWVALLLGCLFHYDRLKLPAPWRIGMLLFFLVAPILFVPLMVVGWHPHLNDAGGIRGVGQNGVSAGWGVVAGILAAAVIQLSAGPGRRCGQLAWPLATVGAALGWQAAVSIALLTLVLALPGLTTVRAGRSGFLSRMGVAGWILPAALVHLLAWRTLTERTSPWWPGPESSLIHAVAALGLLAGLALILKILPEDSVVDPGDRGSSEFTADPSPTQRADVAIASDETVIG